MGWGQPMKVTSAKTPISKFNTYPDFKALIVLFEVDYNSQYTHFELNKEVFSHGYETFLQYRFK